MLQEQNRSVNLKNEGSYDIFKLSKWAKMSITFSIVTMHWPVTECTKWCAGVLRHVRATRSILSRHKHRKRLRGATHGKSWKCLYLIGHFERFFFFLLTEDHHNMTSAGMGVTRDSLPIKVNTHSLVEKYGTTLSIVWTRCMFVSVRFMYVSRVHQQREPAVGCMHKRAWLKVKIPRVHCLEINDCLLSWMHYTLSELL